MTEYVSGVTDPDPSYIYDHADALDFIWAIATGETKGWLFKHEFLTVDQMHPNATGSVSPQQIIKIAKAVCHLMGLVCPFINSVP